MKYAEYIDIKKNDRKNQAIITAAQLFIKNGISAVKMTDIADESEIGVASLYRYFNTKKQLVIDVATYMWNDLNPLFSDIVNGEKFNNADGFEQVKILAGTFCILFEHHSIFLNFIHDFDAFVLSEKISCEELYDYEKSIFNFYHYFESAIIKGRKNKMIREDFDIRNFYFTATHSLLALSQKLTSPHIIKSDSSVDGKEELAGLTDILTFYIRNQNNI